VWVVALEEKGLEEDFHHLHYPRWLSLGIPTPPSPPPVIIIHHDELVAR